MKTKFKKSSCVAVGAFNVYIIQPEWLADRGFFKNSEITTEMKLDEPGFRYEEEDSPLRWVVTPTRVAVESDDEEVDCGQVIARLLGLLPETPLSAVGNNALFVVDRPPEPPPLPVARSSGGYNVLERIYHVALEADKTVFNLGLRYQSLGTELLINTHRPIVGRDGQAVAHASSFLAHRSEGLRLALHHFEDSPCSTHSKH